MNLKLLAGVAVAALTAASGAMAQDQGFYAAVDGGYHWNTPMNTHSSGNDTVGGFNQPYDWRYKNDSSWLAFGRLGYRFSPHVRAEIEGGYRDSKLQSVRSNLGNEPVNGLCNVNSVAPDCGHARGSLNTYSAMANVLFDILPPESRFSPFIGGGLGAVRIENHQVGRFNTATVNEDAVVNTDQTKFAYQGIAGVTAKISEHLNLDLTYRYLAADGYHWRVNNVTSGGTLFPGDFKSSYQDQSVTVGLRYTFGSTPPPPPQPRNMYPPGVEPPPEPPRRAHLPTGQHRGPTRYPGAGPRYPGGNKA